MPAATLPQRRTLLLLPALVALTGCPRHLDFGKDGEPTSAEDVLKRVDFAEAQVHSVKGDARLGVDSPQGKGSVTLFVAVQEPTSIHIEQLDFFGRPQGSFITDGVRFGLFAEGKYFHGPATASNLGRFLPVVLPPRELAAIMLGRAPRLAAEHAEFHLDERTGQFVVTLTRGELTQTLWVEPPSYRVVKSEAKNLAAYGLTFGEVTDYGPLSLPKFAAIDATSANTAVELHWKDIAVNEPPDEALFDLSAPEGVPVIEVDGDGAAAR